MSAPLYEQAHNLNNFIHSWNPHPLPLGPAQRPSEHQGLFLATDDDVLIGRAENGGAAHTSLVQLSSITSGVARVAS